MPNTATMSEIDQELKRVEKKKTRTNYPPPAKKQGLDTLPKNWKEEILKLYADGRFDTHTKIWIREQRGSFSNKLWSRWLAEEDEFLDVIQYGHDLSYKYWIDIARDNLTSRSFNNPTWKTLMVNIFNWRDVTLDMNLDDKSAKSKTDYSKMSETDLMKSLGDGIEQMRSKN